MQNTPFNGAGRRPTPHPLLAIVPSPTVIYLYLIQSALCRICMNCALQGYVAIHEMWKKSKSTCSICVGGPDRLPALSPRSVGGAVGGGEGWRARSCLGILSREGGISGKQAASWNGWSFWQVNPAGYSRGWIWQVFTARYFGGSFWRIYLAGHFGTFIWRVFTSNEKTSCWAMKKRKRKCTISESVDCIMSLYIASNIVICSRCRFNWTSKLWSCNRGYCGSVDLTANEIYIMMKKLGPISVVFYCWCVLCVRQFTSKRGRRSTTATCC